MSSFDPLDLAFRASQELYKAGLLSMINGRRQARGRPPVAWPQVAPTPADVLWQQGNARLIRYRRDTPPTVKTPLLLVCSLINRPYVLDLLAERSVVRRLLERGHDVWLLDWGTPTAADAARSLGDYALEQLPRAAAVVTERAGTDRLHLLGYCMGGTLSLMAIAADRLPAASLVSMATPVALHDDGLLSLWCRAPGFEPAELARAYGNVPPHVLQPAFKMLDPVSLATKFVHLDAKVEDDDALRFFLAMETWLEDSVAFPGRAFTDWIDLYRSDALARGELVLDGVPIDLRRVRCPLFHVIADSDYITPPASSLALETLTSTRAQKTVRLSGGHIGLSTGRTAHERLWPAVSEWLRENDAAAQQVAPRRDASAQKSPKLPVAARKVARPQPRHEPPRHKKGKR
ncbi:MAG TPA: alpha/beta fold hydrolase [Polyangia bacterium]|nr:alpha/beta fold hydrolase [Polyangia bacterium]